MAAKGVAATLDGLRSRPELNHLRVCILGQAQPNGRVPCTVYSLALLPDGLRFVSGSSDATARVAYHGLAP